MRGLGRYSGFGESGVGRGRRPPDSAWRQAILSETPEVYGAEHLLTRRAVSREVGEKLLTRIKWWKIIARETCGDGQQSIGRKQGRCLTTILEKSLARWRKVARQSSWRSMNTLNYRCEGLCVHGFAWVTTRLGNSQVRRVRI